MLFFVHLGSHHDLLKYCSLHHRHHYCYFLMNYTLQQLKDRVNTLIEQQGETAYCAAWIYTKEDIHLKDENGEFDYDNEADIAPWLVSRIFDDIGNIDYIYQVIQESLDESVEEHFVQYQQEMV